MLALMNPEAVDGIYEEAAGLELARLAAEVPPGQAIVEIGVFRGRSLSFLAAGAWESPVYGIDPWNLRRPSKPKYSSDETYAYAREVFKDDENVTLVRDFSVEAAVKYAGPKIGLLHIDADHRYEGVMSDFRSWQRHLTKGAVVCFDDYSDLHPGVVKFVNECRYLGGIYMPAGCTRLAVTRYIG